MNELPLHHSIGAPEEPEAVKTVNKYVKIFTTDAFEYKFIGRDNGECLAPVGCRWVAGCDFAGRTNQRRS